VGAIAEPRRVVFVLKVVVLIVVLALVVSSLTSQIERI
jgi:hypothetical protein